MSFRIRFPVSCYGYVYNQCMVCPSAEHVGAAKLLTVLVHFRACHFVWCIHIHEYSYSADQTQGSYSPYSALSAVVGIPAYEASAK